MTEATSKTKTGLFVTIGLGLFVFSILIFGGDRVFLKSYARYKVQFPSTQGLGKGSVVSLSGMQVGNVYRIEFDKDAQLVAVLNIDREFKHLITTDAIASIRTQGALGDKYIYISPGSSSSGLENSSDSNHVAENGFIKTETQPDILELLTGKGSDMAVISGILKELNQLLHNINSNGKSALLVENLVVASQDVSKLMNEPNLRESMALLKSILKKIDKGDGTLGQLINDPALHERLVGLLGESSRNKYLKPLLREAIKDNEKKR